MKYLKLICSSTMAFALALVVASCGGDDASPTNSGGPKDEGTGYVSDALSPDQQKQQLESTANELLNKVSAADFNEISNIAHYVDQNYLRNSAKKEALESWWDAAMKATEIETSGDVIKRLYLASNFVGAFEYQNGEWVKTRNGGDDLVFTFPYNSGTCVATVKASGETYQVHHEELDTHKYTYGYDYSKRITYENRIGVPQYVTVTLINGGKTLISVNVKTYVKSGTEISLSSDIAEVTVNATVADYTINVSQAKFTGGSGVTASFEIKKNSEMLVKATATANGSFSDKGKLLKAGKMDVDADVLGKVQLRGTISNFDTMKSYLEVADENRTNETEYKSALDNANKQLNIGVYYNYSDTKMSYLQFAPYKKSDYSGERWYREEVICFRDGSSYNTVENFFDNTGFKAVKKRFDNLITNFGNLFKF